MPLTGYSVPTTLHDDAGNALKGVAVVVTGPSAYSGTATTDATSGVLRLGPLPVGDYTVTLGSRSVVVPVVASAADVVAEAVAASADTYPAKAGAETISGQWTFATPPVGVGVGGGSGITAGTAVGQVPVWDGDSYEPSMPMDVTAADVAFTPTGTIAATNVQAAVAEVATEAALVTHTAQTGTAYTLVLADAGRTVEMNNAAANTLTVPPNGTVAFPVGTVIGVRQYGAGQTTVAAGAGVTVRSRGAALKLAGQYAEASLVKRAADEWMLTGDVTA